MKTVSEFPRRIVVNEDVRIPVGDGVSLSARLWLPEDAGDDPVPLILEHLPYRKRDGTVARDEVTHPYVAGHGYACLRTDMRGNGDSDGLMADEYTQTEWDDALRVMAWARAQPWCSGEIGMMGISWGGFNGLQLAAMRPAGLKAVISLCTTVDRYTDDIHYKGGAMLGENLGWAAQMLAYSSRPPDPAIVGARWREMWLRRLEAQPFLLETWLDHQTRDSYWAHGSISEDYAAIEVPVLVFGGWHDGYRNAPAALVHGLGEPSKAIVGPWIHKYPHLAGPEPRIGFLQEALRWWDRWLKGLETGIEAEPRERLWLMDSVHPARWVDERPGRWIAHDSDLPQRVFFLTKAGLAEKPSGFSRRIATTQVCGRDGGEYFPFAFGPELPDEQSGDDALSACFDSAGFGECEIVGAPEVTLRVTPHADTGMIAVRLCDLRPDGTSMLITHGFLNLSHRTSHSDPSLLTPGEEIDVSLRLDQCAYRLPDGHRIRLAISTTYWPFLWPQPDAAGVTVHGGKLSLPARGSGADDKVTFEAPEGAAPWRIERLRDAGMTRRIEVAADGTEVTIIETDDGMVRDLEHGLETGSKSVERWSIHADDPLSATAEISWETTIGREDWRVSTHCTARLCADADTWYPRASIEARIGDETVFQKAFKRDIPRKFV